MGWPVRVAAIAASRAPAPQPKDAKLVAYGTDRPRSYVATVNASTARDDGAAGKTMHRPPCSTAMSNSPATTTMMLTSYDFKVILGQLGGAAPRRRHVPAQGVTKIGLDNSDAGRLIRVIAAFLRSQVANVAVVDKALTTPIETPVLGR